MKKSFICIIATAALVMSCGPKPGPTTVRTDTVYVHDTVYVERVQLPVPAQQFVLFTVSPADALIEFDGAALVPLRGEAAKLVEAREAAYSYTVSAKGYYAESGEVVVSKDSLAEVKITLREARGCLSVKSCCNPEIEGAMVFIDGELVGAAPVDVCRLQAGRHVLTIAKDMYNNYNGEIVVKDNDTLVVSPCLNPAFSVVEIKTAETADIWVDGVKKGQGSWSGPVLAGTHSLSASQYGCSPSDTTVVIPAGSAEVICLDVPAPVVLYGKIIVTSSPAKADVVINGRLAGKTPLILDTVPFGEYCVLVGKEGCEIYHECVVMDEAKTVEINADIFVEGCCEGACTEACCHEACTEACTGACGEEACCHEACTKACEGACTGACGEEACCQEACCEKKCAEPCAGACCEKKCTEPCAGACAEKKCTEPCCEKKCEECAKPCAAKCDKKSGKKSDNVEILVIGLEDFCTGACTAEPTEEPCTKACTSESCTKACCEKKCEECTGACTAEPAEEPCTEKKCEDCTGACTAEPTAEPVAEEPAEEPCTKACCGACTTEEPVATEEPAPVAEEPVAAEPVAAEPVAAE